MSRTYRCRHLAPSASWGGGKAAKIVDGRGGSGNWRYRRQIIEDLVISQIGPRPEPSTKFVKWGHHYKGVYTYRKEFNYNYLTKRWVFMEVPCYEYKKFPGHFITTWEAFEWDRFRDKVEQDFAWPTASFHPWARNRVGSAKTYYKRRANREMRRRSRQVIQAEKWNDSWNDWEGDFPNKHDYLNWRDFC